MQWLLALLAVLFMVAPAMAGEDPYIAIVGKDCVPTVTNAIKQVCGADGTAIPFYFSPKYQQFMYDENDPTTFAIPTSFGTFPPKNQFTRVGSAGQEQFRSQTANNQTEVCYAGPGTNPADSKNSKTPASNAGFYEWYINLPKKPSGEINIVIQCGVVKPNALAFFPPPYTNPSQSAIELCAAETGEYIGVGMCVRDEVDPGASPVNQLALPKITAIAYPGAYNVVFTPFKLTAFKNPSSYQLSFDGSGAMTNDGASQLHDGSSNARVLLKACMDKSIVAKLPVTGQVNASGEPETDLVAGDIIYVRMDVPRQNTVDIYCHEQSVRIAGVGEGPDGTPVDQ